MSVDYYQVLGVNRTASESDIQKAYRRLARKHHPDLAEDKARAKEEFQKIQTAYDVLSDPEKRKLYDQLGPNFESYANAGQGRGGGPQMQFDFRDIFGGPGGGMSMEELLRQFGGRGGQRGTRRSPFESQPEFERQPPPQESRETITIPFQTAVLGGHHQLQVTHHDGKSETIRLKIPAGIVDGKSLRLRGQGQEWAPGQRGDLLVTVKVAPHPFFKRTGQNLHLTVPITIAEAIRGGKIEIPSPHGTLTLTIPPRSSGGRQLRLTGMGVRSKSAAPGDLIVELQIVLPEACPEEQWAEFEKLAENMPRTLPRKALRW